MKYNRGTEIKLDDYTNLNVVFGSIDKHNPKTIYLRLSGWGNPINYYEQNNYKTIIRQFDKKIRGILFRELNEYFNHNMTMVDMDMRESGIIDNKSSFMSCETTLYQTGNYLLNSDNILNEIKRITEIIINEVFRDNEYFEFHKKKKSANASLKEA